MGFWSEDYWLPRNVTWQQIPSKFEDLIYPIYLAVPLVIIRLLWESLVGVPIAHVRGIYPKGSSMTANMWDHISGGFAQNTKPKRVLECFWRFSYYTFSFTYGVWVMKDQSWLYDVRDCWIGYPFHPVPTAVWWYYMIETGFYYSLILASTFDVRRSDFMELMLHHVITIFLLSSSWLINFVRSGTLILLSHDVADVFLEGGKLVRYDSHNKFFTNIMFVLFLSSWILTRLVYYPFVFIRSALTEAADLIQPDYVLTDLTMAPYAPRIIIFALVALLALHVFWTVVILKIVVRTITGQQAKDVRSDSDSDYDEEEQKKREERKKLLRKTRPHNDGNNSDDDNIQNDRKKQVLKQRRLRKE